MASATARNEAKRPMIFTCFSLQLKGDDDAGDQGGTSGTGHPAGGRGSHSAFQQLFPRARKLLEQQQQLHSLPQAHHHHRRWWSITRNATRNSGPLPALHPPESAAILIPSRNSSKSKDLQSPALQPLENDSFQDATSPMMAHC